MLMHVSPNLGLICGGISLSSVTDRPKYKLINFCQSEIDKLTEICFELPFWEDLSHS